MLTAKQLKDLEAEEACADSVLVALLGERGATFDECERANEARMALTEALEAENGRWWWSAPVRLEAA